MRAIVFIGLGANLGEPAATIRSACAQIGGLPDTTVTAVSPIYRSAPVGASGPDYLNAALAASTALPPDQLLTHMFGIERSHGRVRPYRNAPRSLDLDLLLYGDDVIDTPRLSIPHPRMHERAFVLRPLSDIAPDLHIPGQGALAPLLARLTNQFIVPVEP